MGVVEGDLREGFQGGGEIGGGFRGWMVAPGTYGVEIGEEIGALLGCGRGGKAGGEGFAVELLREGVGEVFEEDEGDEDGVARGPRLGVVGEHMELEREVVVLGGDGGVDAGGVAFEVVELVGGELSEDTVGGRAEGEGALEAIVGDEAGAEDLGELAGGMAAEGVHLEETIPGGGEALGEEEIVEGVGVDRRDAAGVARDGDGGGEAGGDEGAGELREISAGGGVKPEAGNDDGGRGEEEDGEEAEEAEASGSAGFPGFSGD